MLTKDELIGAIARGWSHQKNAKKTMDSDLVHAIHFEVSAALRAQADAAPVAWQWRRKGEPWTLEKTFNSEVFATTNDSEVRPLFDGAFLRAAATAIHYPECWDTTAYPTLPDALSAVYTHYQCTNEETHPSLAAAQGLSDAVTALRDAIQDMRSIGHEVPESASLVGYFCNRLKQSAATVAEPSECEVCRKTGMAHSAHQPSEWVKHQVALVPILPTPEMKAAGASVNNQGMDFAHHTWTVMLDAAQQQAEPGFDVEVASIMEKIPTVARLYYTGIGARRYRRASTMNGPGEPLVHRSHAERELKLLAAQSGQRAGVAEKPVFWIGKSDLAWLERTPDVNAQITALRLGGASRVPVFLAAAPTQQQERSE